MKRGTPDHPKMRKLGRAMARSLGVPRNIGDHVACSTVARLFDWSARYAQDGDVSKPDPDDVAEGLHWEGDPGELFELLLGAGWLDEVDGRYLIHGWAEHCEDSVHVALARSRRYFADGTQPRVSRLTEKERAPILAWFKGNPWRAHGERSGSAQKALEERTASAREALEERSECAQEALDERTASPSLAKPSLARPRPSQAKEQESGRAPDGAGGSSDPPAQPALGPELEAPPPKKAKRTPRQNAPPDVVRAWDEVYNEQRYGEPPSLTAQQQRDLAEVYRNVCHKDLELFRAVLVAFHEQDQERYPVKGNGYTPRLLKRCALECAERGARALRDAEDRAEQARKREQREREEAEHGPIPEFGEEIA